MQLQVRNFDCIRCLWYNNWPGIKSNGTFTSRACCSNRYSGIDDEGELGKLRVQKTYQMLNKTDIAVIVIDLNEKNNNTKYSIKKVW